MNHYSNSFSLLTIDDDERLRRSIRIFFEDSGVVVFEAADGMSGLEMFRAHHPDVVLVDLSMPVMNGLEFIDQLRMESPDQPVIVISGTGNLQSAVDAVHRGVWDFVTKPILNMAALEHTVRRCVERAILKRENKQYSLHLEKLVETRTAEITRTRQQIVERLGRAAEYRDNETGMHVMRMSRYSQLLALKAGMNSHETGLMQLAASMHDIGKIGIRDSILLKEGKLTPEEWAVMMTHVQIGAYIIGDDPSELMQMARTVALTHHERWNGQGYPNKLAGEEIPLVGRIVAIADVFDALTSARPYKPAWPPEVALKHLLSEAGQQFDPNLVPLFMEIIPDILAIQAQYQD
ncbi:MAG: response regulator [Gallionella sp.]|nr:response regulator [Gallionella sp.]